MAFSERFLIAHSALAPTVAPEVFAEVAQPAALGFASRADYYAPVTFCVQISRPVSGGVSGALQLELPVHSNPRWLDDLKGRVARITGRECEALCTVNGTPLEALAPHQLANAGKLFVHISADGGGRAALLAAPPARIPPEYSVHKVRDLRAWVAQFVRGNAAPAVAAALAGKAQAVHELEAAIRPGGVVQQQLERHLRETVGNADGVSHSSWADFVGAHCLDPTAKRDPEVVLRRASETLLSYVRAHVRASARAIQEHVAQVAAQLAGADSVLVAQQQQSHGGANTKAGTQLFQRVMDDALASPALEHELVSILYTETGAQQQQQQKVAPPRLMDARGARHLHHHPMNAQLHATLLPLRGAYPSYYIAQHTRRDMSAQAPYPSSNVVDTYRAYHKFARMHPVPPALKVMRTADQRLVAAPAVEARMRERLRPVDGEFASSSESESDDERPERVMGAAPTLVPLMGAAPTLVPLEGAAPIEGCHARRHKKKQDKDKRRDDYYMAAPIGFPALKPIEGGAQLVGCSGNYYSSSSSSDSEVVEERIGGPVLVPIEGCHGRRRRSKRRGEKDERGEYMEASIGPGAFPTLVPVEAAEDEIGSDSEDFSHLPAVADIFK